MVLFESYKTKPTAAWLKLERLNPPWTWCGSLWSMTLHGMLFTKRRSICSGRVTRVVGTVQGLRQNKNGTKPFTGGTTILEAKTNHEMKHFMCA